MKTTAIVGVGTSLLLGVLLGAGFPPDGPEENSGAVPFVVVSQPSAPLPVSQAGYPSFMSPHASPIALEGGLVFVANTPADTVDVIDAASLEIKNRIRVGVDPVSVAVRPDGMEVWVSNHVSDSVSVIDNDPAKPTYLQVVATIQKLDRKSRSTRFDEPVGIAFASNEKAYVALSSENQIAVVDVKSRKVEKTIDISAQDPRAIRVRGDRLYVIPFESNNRTQLSGGTGEIDGELVTFNAHEHSVANNNVLSLGAVLDIVKHPDVPDRDLYVFDTKTDELIEVVDTLGTLLYGLTVDSKGRVFVAQADARNEVNGRAGTKDHGLSELENRAFLNQITTVDFKDGKAGSPQIIDLEPLPPNHPDPDKALATPFAIQISDDNSILVVSAAGSDRIFTVDANSGEVLGRARVDSVPRGIALESGRDGGLSRAWVYNAVANSVSLVDVNNPARPEVVDTIPLQDPTHPAVKRGRIAFNQASASTTGTFSCASCHPDGHTDQLLWVLETPVVTGGDQIMPRSTMPVRGLRDTAPFHWDGIPGDPYGGNNSEHVFGHVEPNSEIDDPQSSTRHLVDGALATTMSQVGSTLANDEGKAGALNAKERDDLAKFLLAVPYPPAQRRAYNNELSTRAKQGYELFHIKGDLQGEPKPNVCGDCHRMPFLVSTNTPGTGMDAPTWRGANDRWLILPQGRLNIIDFDFYRRVAERGIPERRVWQFSWAGRRRFDPVWDMVLEGSTGFSGAFARQVTVNEASIDDEITHDLLDALEQSAGEGATVLQVTGAFLDDRTANPVVLQYDVSIGDGAYVAIEASQDDDDKIENRDDRTFWSREELISLASHGSFLGTFTALHGVLTDFESPQPAIWTVGPIEAQRGRQDFPILYSKNHRMTVSGRHIHDDAFLVVDGRRVSGTIHVTNDADEKIQIQLATLPKEGMHLLQVQNPDGLLSNDFIFHVTANAEAADDLNRRLEQEYDPGAFLNTVISSGDLDRLKGLIADGLRINGRNPDGSTLLGSAALYGQIEIGQFLLGSGARVSRTNRDGNTPLHIAAFLCDFEFVELLLENDASISKKNDRGESSTQVVSSPWTGELAGFYRMIGNAVGIEIDLERMERDRPRMAKLLRDYAEGK